MSDIKKELINDCKNLIYKIASRYSRYYDIEDLFQVGVIGVMHAIDNYKKDSKAKFSTYAYSYIFGEILEFIKNDRAIKVNSKHLKLYKEYERVSEYLTQKNNKIPTFTEISEFMEIDESVLYDALIGSEFTLSLDNTFKEEKTFYDTIGEDNREFIDNIISLRNGISKLSVRNREIIRCRYYKDYTQDETAKILGLTQVQVSRYEKKAVEELRNRIAC